MSVEHKGSFQTQEVEKNLRRFCGGTLFSDHASSLSSVYFQVLLGVTDTMRNKELYELAAEEDCVKLKSYRGDNNM